MVSEPGPGKGAEAPPGKRRLSKRVKRRVGAGALAVLALAFAWLIHHLLVGQYVETTDDAYLKADTVLISSRITGYAARILVTDNEWVTAGQPLVSVDPKTVAIDVRREEASSSVAFADYGSAQGELAENEAAVAKALARLATARSEQRFAARQLERYKPLQADGAEAAEKIAGLAHELDVRTNSAVAAEAELRQSVLRSETLAVQIRRAESGKAAAAAALAGARSDLADTIIRASVAGRIGAKTVRAGQLIQPGSRLMSIVPVEQIHVIANFKETQLARIRPGQPVLIRVDGFPDDELHGHVVSISPGTGAEFSLLPPQNATGNFTKIVQRVPVKIALDEGPGVRRKLIAGLSVHVSVDTRPQAVPVRDR